MSPGVPDRPTHSPGSPEARGALSVLSGGAWGAWHGRSGFVERAPAGHRQTALVGCRVEALGPWGVWQGTLVSGWFPGWCPVMGSGQVGSWGALEPGPDPALLPCVGRQGEVSEWNSPAGGQLWGGSSPVLSGPPGALPVLLSQPLGCTRSDSLAKLPACTVSI